MVNILNIFDPIRLYVPSGWYVLKNHLFSIDKPKVLSIEGEDEKWRITDFFIGPTIFMARQEYPLNTTTVLMAVLDAGCRILQEEILELEYEVNLTVYLKKKKSTKILKLTNRCYTADEAGDALSEYALLFSHQELFDFKSGNLQSEWQGNLEKRLMGTEVSNYL